MKNLNFKYECFACFEIGTVERRICRCFMVVFNRRTLWNKVVKLLHSPKGLGKDKAVKLQGSSRTKFLSFPPPHSFLKECNVRLLNIPAIETGIQHGDFDLIRKCFR